MRIEWIEVENFKGFDKRRFEFDEHFTLFVGENGSGKTTAVAMASQLLAAWTESIAGGGASRAKARDALRIDTAVLPSGKVSSYVLPLKFTASIMVDTSRIKVAGITKGNGDAHAFLAERAAELRNLAREFSADGLQFQRILPVCVCYPAHRKFADALPDWGRIMAAKPFRKDGYENWDNERSPAGRLSEWMGRQEAIAQEDKVEASSYVAVKATINAALPGCRKCWFSAKAGEPVVEWNSGRLVGYSTLSDGQRVILTIVGDIARRAALLNPHLDDPASETPGVVVIDEIDLHLHPRWQRRIMEDLRRVFPKIQFIATTHSPVIISAAKDAKVIQLDEHGSHELGQAYGLDLNSVVEDVQGGQARPHEIKEMLVRANDLIGEGKLAEARETTARIRRVIHGPDRELVELDTTIDNLEALAHAPD